VHRQDVFFSVPEGEDVAAAGPDHETFVGRVIHFMSADINVSGQEGAGTKRYDLAFVRWLCEYQQPAEMRTIVDRWMDCNPLYEPTDTYYDVIETARIVGPEVLVPNYHMPTIPSSVSQYQKKLFEFGKADTQQKKGSAMYIRHTFLRRSMRMHPRMPGSSSE
jgi:hypothetical protein